LLPLSRAIQLDVLPLRLLRQGESSRLLIAVPPCFGVEKHTHLSFAVGCEIEATQCSTETIGAARVRAYRGSLEDVSEALCSAEDSLLSSLSVASEVSEALECIVFRASLLSASDIHFQPMSKATQIRFRVANILEDGLSLTPELSSAIARRVRVLSNAPQTSLGEPFEGGFRIRAYKEDLRLRVSILPTQNGNKVVLRLLDTGTLSTASGTRERFLKLGMTSRQGALFSASIASDRGLLLVSGPTGSGKSTLLATALQVLNRPTRNIITLEDPVERVISGISQIEIDSEKALDYSALLPLILRQDPDVVMLGEIRDKKTALTACEASLVGTLVLSSIHAPSALQCIVRLLQLGIPADILSSGLRLVSSQRLLGVLCAHCKMQQKADSRIRQLFRLEQGAKIFRKGECEMCAGRGVVGLVSVFEMIPFTESLQHKLLGRSLNAHSMYRIIREMLIKDRHCSMGESIRNVLIAGDISPETALVALGIQPDVIGYK